MNARQFKRFLESVTKLTASQLEQVRSALATEQTVRASYRAIEVVRPCTCRRCGSEKVVRNGVQNGLQRFLCRSCGKTFNATTGTPLSRLRDKERFEAYAQCMRKGYTVRQAAAEVGLTLDRAFRWRHRFLSEVVTHQPKGVTGILEVDETYFRESQKGARKLTRPARKRGGKASGRGRKSKDWIPVLVGRARGQAHTADRVLGRLTGAEVTDALKDAVTPGDTIVCTDGHSAFLHLQRTLGVQTKYFVSSYHGPVLDKVYHVQSANNYHERLKTWIQRKLRGVATKYLPNYLAWQRLMSWKKDGVSAEEIIASALGRQVINV